VRPAASRSSLRCSEAATERVRQHRPARTCSAPMRATGGPPLVLGRREDPGRQARAPDRAVGRDAHGLEPVDAPELLGHLARGAGHPGELQVAPEEALVARARERLPAPGERDLLLGLDHLVQPLSQARSGSTRPVYSSTILDLVVAHQVVGVPVIEAECRQGLDHQLLAPAPGPPESAERPPPPRAGPCRLRSARPGARAR